MQKKAKESEKKAMAKITVNITKDKDNNFIVKCGTSVGGGREKCKSNSLKDVKDFIGNIIERLDKDGYIGRK